MVFPVTVGEIPNIAEHAIEGTRWNKMSIDVHDEDYMVTGKKRLSAFYPTDLEMLLRNLGIRRVVFTGCMTAYTTPQLLGGTDTRVLATMVYQYAMSLRDWTQASVVAVVMIVVTMLVSSVFNSVSRKINPMA